ncbi:T9SS type A sorting domain-containing protein [uncultured Spirosoma sp.]|uniref:T9SS type A sorting domain-containing protein n=1 Tax=uncultured Spirosoma sp. TaxID=278208 RepID=UPI002584ED48|nr:T9SS type A sorting domain-containing protein [uncultured Spirosoma sp.]
MKPLLLVAFLVISLSGKASHLLGGYVRATPVAGQALRYTLTTTLYAYKSPATTELVSVSFCLGDGTTQLISRKSQTAITTDGTIVATVFETTYTYPGAGTYTASVAIANRSGQLNIPSAEASFLTLTTTFFIGTTLTNQTPIAAIPTAGFRLAVNQRAVLALRATDPENDSIRYTLARPVTTTSNNTCQASELTQYTFPNDVAKQGTFTLNSQTGELVWTAPVRQGTYSVAVLISEYRNGINISQTLEEIPLLVIDQAVTPVAIPPYEPAMSTGIVTAVSPPVDASMQLSAFPNPVEENLQVVVLTNTPAVVMVQLLDANGRQLHQLGTRTPVRRHEQVIGMGSLSAGTYLIRADIGGRILTEKVVKK